MYLVRTAVSRALVAGAVAFVVTGAALGGCGFEGASTSGVVVAVEGGTAEAAEEAGGDAAPISPPRYDGWSPVVVAGSRPALGADAGAEPVPSCPAGTSSPITYLENARASGGACSCTCGATAQNPCTQGDLLHQFANNTTCNDQFLTGTTDGTCKALPSVAFFWDSGNNKLSGAPLAPVGVACAATAVPPPIADDGAVTVCKLDGADAPAGSKTCHVRDGDHACPATGLVKRAAGTVTDARTCGACTCATDPATTTCTNARITFFDDPACAAAKRTDEVVLDPGGGCAPFGVDTGTTPTHWRYTATATAPCSPVSATSAVSGDVTKASSVTLCCAP